jgi:hypothetical protein
MKMAKIKGWEKASRNNWWDKNHSSTVDVEKVGMSKLWIVERTGRRKTNQGEITRIGKARSLKQAEKIAYAYMRSHPNG